MHYILRKALDELLNIPSDAEQEYKPQLVPGMAIQEAGAGLRQDV